VILLLNLLIAMMGRTYERMEDEAIIHWRTEFARRVRRLQLLGSTVLGCCFFGSDNMHAGKQTKIRGDVSIYVYTENVRLKPDPKSGRLVDLNFFGSEEEPIGEEALHDDNEPEQEKRGDGQATDEGCSTQSEALSTEGLLPSASGRMPRWQTSMRGSEISLKKQQSQVQPQKQTQTSESIGEGKQVSLHSEPVYDLPDARSTIKMRQKEGRGDGEIPKLKGKARTRVCVAPLGYPKALTEALTLQEEDEDGELHGITKAGEPYDIPEVTAITECLRHVYLPWATGSPHHVIISHMDEPDEDPDKWTGLLDAPSQALLPQLATPTPPQPQPHSGAMMEQLMEAQRNMLKELQELKAQKEQKAPIQPPPQLQLIRTGPQAMRAAPTLPQQSGNGPVPQMQPPWQPLPPVQGVPYSNGFSR